ncbi:protein of unknown function UPF0102 [Desulforamulus reducens MI-1]|uniref:UPF0102 protein Dred_2035 n=1 Tax=Desulforamulus reducens (strain ATCC BAA-1160 / DSM 100696 / MI-1) TaxID=349161 RepID=Y2035_DESRM|nr:YraN family protein [Desulforamulus reducens]A4J649.1 RecName: Full=UPF0102 protein Dred_2035 [Desulforamulus reducens MI-1]ABO50552.1 protein of unknown function UPF0102 [Desulforamulus reducens MI-1]
MSIQRKALGNKGEEEACKYIQNLGYNIMERNYRCKIGELDIIAWDPVGMLVFLEVRSRSGRAFGVPEESVNYRKQNKLRMLAQQFLLTKSEFAKISCRFDVIGVYFNKEGSVQEIKHIKNAL